ncbi:MAG: ferritin family protein [Planctomycetes bacterium]|nr:ferritin family protein [Planctomycetota bacterium]
MITFNADEIFEMAEQIERNGAKFYRAAAKSTDGQSRALLEHLASMEDDHEKTFAAMRAELTKAERGPITADPDNEAALYLQAMVAGEIFGGKPTETFQSSQPIEELFNKAIGMEKDSIVFYQSMKEVVPSSVGKDRIDGIIRQEIGHVVELTKQLKAL